MVYIVCHMRCMSRQCLHHSHIAREAHAKCTKTVHCRHGHMVVANIAIGLFIGKHIHIAPVFVLCLHHAQQLQVAAQRGLCTIISGTAQFVHQLLLLRQFAARHQHLYYLKSALLVSHIFIIYSQIECKDKVFYEYMQIYYTKYSLWYFVQLTIVSFPIHYSVFTKSL